MWWKLMEDGETLLWSGWSKATPGGDKWAETMWKRKKEEKMYIKCPGSRSSYWTGPEQGTHLEFSKNQTISSLESEQGRVRKMWKRELGLMKSKGWVSGKIRSQVFLFWLERCRGPQGKLLRAVLVQTACRFWQQPSSSQLQWCWLGSGLALSIPSTQGLHLHSLGLVLIVSLHARWFSSRRDTRELQQHKSVMSTPDNYHDRKSQIPEVTLFILPHPDRPEVSLGIWTWYHPISMKMKKTTGGVFFFPKQNGNINWRQTLLFICARFLQCCTYGFGDLGTYTFPLFYHLWTVIWLTIHGASRLPWHDCRGLCTHA